MKIKRIDETAPLIDPTYNTRKIVDQAVVHLQDLMNAESRRVNEQLALRAEFNEKLSVAESKRIDAIRSVDVQAVSVANERSAAQATVLANQVAASAETLRALVAQTAVTLANQLAQLTTQLTDRIGGLEKSQYEHKGSGIGIKDMWGYIVGVGMFLLLVYQNFVKH